MQADHALIPYAFPQKNQFKEQKTDAFVFCSFFPQVVGFAVFGSHHIK